MYANLNLEVNRSNVHSAADLVDALLDIKSTRSEGEFYGGWHAEYVRKGFGGRTLFHGSLYRNLHQLHGDTYFHHIEHKNYDIMLKLYFNDLDEFQNVQSKLIHPDIYIFCTGYEEGWERAVWGWKQKELEVGKKYQVK